MKILFMLLMAIKLEGQLIIQLHLIRLLFTEMIPEIDPNGLVLDKDGNKMSKRLGNATDPFQTLGKHGADATRWYMISNAQPWDNLKFDEEGILEVRRKFFGTLYNAYSFFALYANIDGFKYNKNVSSLEERDITDRWIISELNSLIKDVEAHYEDYEPTKASREIQDFVITKLSNWYIRLNRRRFWKGEYNSDKKDAYCTLFECLSTIAIVSCPIAPFYMDQLYQDLNQSTNSVHLASFPKFEKNNINKVLETQMQLAQIMSSSILSLRKKEKIRVRQPLASALVAVSNEETRQALERSKEIILGETNLKGLEFLSEDSDMLSKKAKPNFKLLGPKYGSKIKEVSTLIQNLNNEQIKTLESHGSINVNEGVEISIDDVEIVSKDIAGYSVSTNNYFSVALDVSISQELSDEGLAREFINRIQNLRKDKGYLVTDKIYIEVEKNNDAERAIKNNLTYICNETLTEELKFSSKKLENYDELNLVNNIICKVLIYKK